jgi:CRISPR-associated protein Cas2
MNVLVAYDIDTHTREGERRLRQVAKACEGFGQRVQFSLFEVVCSRAKLAKLVAELETIMDSDVDSIRVYLLDNDAFSRVNRLGQRKELAEERSWVL